MATCTATDRASESGCRFPDVRSDPSHRAPGRQLSWLADPDNRAGGRRRPRRTRHAPVFPYDRADDAVAFPLPCARAAPAPLTPICGAAPCSGRTTPRPLSPPRGRRPDERAPRRCTCGDLVLEAHPEVGRDRADPTSTIPIGCSSTARRSRLLRLVRQRQGDPPRVSSSTFSSATSPPDGPSPEDSSSRADFALRLLKRPRPMKHPLELIGRRIEDHDCAVAGTGGQGVRRQPSMSLSEPDGRPTKAEIEDYAAARTGTGRRSHGFGGAWR